MNRERGTRESGEREERKIAKEKKGNNGELKRGGEKKE